MLKKKILTIVFCMLLITTSLFVNFYENTNVKAETGGERDSSSISSLNDYVWQRLENISDVVNDANYYNGIPKGRAWATAGEDYTIDRILIPVLENYTENWQKLPIGYVDDEEYRERQYSSKIVIEDYGLTINDDSYPWEKSIQYSDMFPIGVGKERALDYFYNLNNTFNFTEADVFPTDMTVLPFFNTMYNDNFTNLTGELLNDQDIVLGKASYLDIEDPVPEEHYGYVFILYEEPGCEQKIENMTDAVGCILIENETREYSYQNASQYNFSIIKTTYNSSNLSKVIDDIDNNQTNYIADNLHNNLTITFTSNLNNSLFFPNNDWVVLIQRTPPSDSIDIISEKLLKLGLFVFKTLGWTDIYNYLLSFEEGGLFTGAYYDFTRLIIYQGYLFYIYNCNILHLFNRCKGFILSDFGNTHFMTHTVKDWEWFSGAYSDRWFFPMISVNNSVGDYLNDHYDEDLTVSGFIEQEYKVQSEESPGVESYNVVGYRNISHSPYDNITILSNRIDGWWGETPGDSGAGCAILLGIAKYFDDYDITPKCNLTFLFTTGEEYGMRGAQHFSDSNPFNNITYENNFIRWIGLDQLAFDYTLSEDTMNLTVQVLNDQDKNIMDAIAEETRYNEITDYGFKAYMPEEPGSEDFVFSQREECDTVCMVKAGDDVLWDGYHRSGINYTVGDALDNTDRDDVNATLKLAWNITKYYTVNPGCWMNDITVTPFDSPDDPDSLNDSVDVTFYTNTEVPHDLVTANITLIDNSTQENISHFEANYGIIHTDEITFADNQKSFIFQIPDSYHKGEFYIDVKLYNSTGRINRNLGLKDADVNDTETSESFYLYHPFGCPTLFTDSYEQSLSSRISGAVFMAHENAVADNITVYLDEDPPTISQFKCMIYRADDNSLVGTTETKMPMMHDPTWVVFNFSEPKPALTKDTEYVLTCWGPGNGSLATIFYKDFSDSRGRWVTESFGDPPDPANFLSENKLYSIYCSYTPDSDPPEINDIAAEPDPIGFGLDVTINVSVSDVLSDIDQVKVRIGQPGGRQSNNTMTNTGGDFYEYLFNDTWAKGQYNYSIWAIDDEGNQNESSIYTFNVSADATIGIATLKDTYGAAEYINITDPPTPPEDYYLTERGLDYNKYYNANTGNDVLQAYMNPVNYLEEDEWTPINNTLDVIDQQHPAYEYGYRAGNEKGLYSTYFKPNIQDEWPVAFAYDRSDDPTTDVLRTKLVGVGYLDPTQNWDYEYLQGVLDSQGHIEDYSAIYEDVFTGTDVKWSYGNIGMKEEIILGEDAITMLENNPPSAYGLSNDDSYLVFITRLDYQNLEMHDSSGALQGNFTLTDTGIDFKDALGHFKCALPVGDAYELENELNRIKLTYRIIQYNGNNYLLSGLKLEDLEEMQFPVVVDPTLTVKSSTNDGYILNGGNTYSTVQSASTGTVYDGSDYLYIGQRYAPFGKYLYDIYRSFLYFNTSSLPSNIVINSSTVSLYCYSDVSSADFDIVIQNGQPIFPRNPLESADYNKNYYAGNGGSINTTSLANGRSNITLTNHDWINQDGITKLCLRSSKDINAVQPSTSEYVVFYSREKTGFDNYNPYITIEYRNQSKIKNTGETNISGYLLIQVQYNDSGDWIVDNDTINETEPRTINSSDQLALDLIFNGEVSTSDLTNGDGQYRVYAAFRDPDGEPLICDDESALEAWYEFEVNTT